MASVQEANSSIYTSFKRDTRVDYQKGSPVINCVFALFDTDRNGRFDKNEWKKYEEYVKRIQDADKQPQNNTKNKKVSGLQSNIDNIINQINTKQKEYDKYVEESHLGELFDSILNFEQKHPEILREGYINESEVPEGSVRFNAEPFQMGIMTIDNKYWSGEVYKKGYISGLDKLQTAERNKYMGLVNQFIDSEGEAEKIRQELVELHNAYEETYIVNDFKKNNLEVNFSNIEQYVQLWNDANPFKQKLENTEKEIVQLYRKTNFTTEDQQRVQQLIIQFDQLHELSSNFSIENLPEDKLNELKNGFIRIQQGVTPQGSVTQVSGGLNTRINKNLAANFSASASASKEDTSVVAGLGLNYTGRNINIAPTLTMRAAGGESNVFDCTVGGSVNYNNFTGSVEHKFYSASMNNCMPANTEAKESQSNDVQAQSGCASYKNTTIGLSYIIKGNNGLPKYITGVGANFGINNSINTSFSGEFNLFDNNTNSLKLNATSNNEYNTELNNLNLNAGIELSGKYTSYNTETNVSVTGNMNETYQHNNKPVGTYTVGANANIKYRDIMFQTNLSNQHSDGFSILAFKTGIRSRVSKKLTLGAEYTHTAQTACGNTQHNNGFFATGVYHF